MNVLSPKIRVIVLGLIISFLVVVVNLFALISLGKVEYRLNHDLRTAGENVPAVVTAIDETLAMLHVMEKSLIMVSINSIILTMMLSVMVGITIDRSICAEADKRDTLPPARDM